MKKYVRKVLVYILAMAVILSVALKIGEHKGIEAASTETYNSSEYEYQINEDGSATITKYLGAEEDVIIPNTLDGVKVTSIGMNAFYSHPSLTSITIPNSVISIGEHAFNSCESLVSITIPNSVTSIEESAFAYCHSLTSITIPDSVTSIGDCAFYDCSHLTSITIPDSVTSMGGSPFIGCSSLTSIMVDEKNSVYSSSNNCVIEKNTHILIQGCKASIIPDGVTSIGKGAFQGHSSLTSITIPDSVTSIGNFAFSCCSSLTSITIPDSVTSIGWGTFFLCSSLTSITIPDGVTSIRKDDFQFCSNLTSIIIPNSVTSIEENAFYGCSNKLTIYGSVGSYAQKYANEYNIPFRIYNGHNFGVDTIIGTLEAVNLNNFTIKIDGADYNVSDDFNFQARG